MFDNLLYKNFDQEQKIKRTQLDEVLDRLGTKIPILDIAQVLEKKPWLIPIL